MHCRIANRNWPRQPEAGSNYYFAMGGRGESWANEILSHKREHGRTGRKAIGEVLMMSELANGREE